MKKTFLVLSLALISLLTACGKCEHQYEAAVTTEASCSAVGTKTYTCTLCEDSYTEEIPLLAHTYESTVTLEATCTEVGQKTTACTVCGDSSVEEIPAAGHTMVDASCESPKHCANCTLTEGSALGHTWQDATCTSAKKCSRCGAVSGGALGHSWDDGVVTKKATFESTGTKLFTCGRCGNTKTEKIAKKSIEISFPQSFPLTLNDTIWYNGGIFTINSVSWTYNEYTYHSTLDIYCDVSLQTGGGDIKVSIYDENGYLVDSQSYLTSGSAGEKEKVHGMLIVSGRNEI